METQHRLWPQLSGSQELPEITDAVLDDMAAQFRHSFVTQTVRGRKPDNGRKTSWKALAAAYLRYSCDNSNPRSLNQQLRLTLERASQNSHFVPWSYVFADAAVTGTTAARGGYQLAKQTTGLEEANVGALYIDEIGRAARDMIEAYKLGQLIVERHNKRLIGVSDGFDTNNPMWKTVLAIFGALQEWFIDQLRSKVKRGRQDAFARGTNLGGPAIGYKLVKAVDADGSVICDRAGVPLKSLAISKRTAKYVREAFTLFTERKWSRAKIARYFNRRKVGGRQTWDGSRIGQLLHRWKYVGIHVDGVKRQWRDPVTGKVHTERRPRSEWRVRRVRHLQIVPWKLWKATQKRLNEIRDAYKSSGHSFQARSDLYATTLIRPICGVCGKPLWLGRSGKYGSFCCLAGKEGKDGCTFKGYKSVRIVEGSILAILEQNILTDERAQELVDRANNFLAEECAKPKQDLRPFKREIRQIQAKLERLLDLIEDEHQTNGSELAKRVAKHEVRLTELRRELRQAESQGNVPEPLGIDDVRASLSDLRTLLRTDVAVAAPVLRELTGPVIVRQRQETGKQKSTWIAEFTANAAPVLLVLARAKNCPSTRTLEYLNSRSWTNPQQVLVRLEQVTQYERLGPKFAKLYQDGAKVQEIASAHGMPWKQAKEILDYGLTGERPQWPSHSRTENGSSGPPLHEQIRDDVVRLRNEEQRTWPKIVEWLDRERAIKTSEATVRQAYDKAHQEEMREALENGTSPDRGRWRHLPPKKVKLMRKLLNAGKLTPTEIARKVHVSINTVRRERDAMENGD